MLTLNLSIVLLYYYGNNKNNEPTNKQKTLEKELENFVLSEKLLGEAKIQCKEKIKDIGKEINDKLSFITLRAEQLEEEEHKINHLLKLLQNRFASLNLSKYNKIAKENEITKQELEEALRENYDLHETLEEMNMKTLEKQDMLEQENKHLKEQIKLLLSKRS